MITSRQDLINYVQELVAADKKMTKALAARNHELADQIAEENAPYGVEMRRVVSATLAGGGPAGWVDFAMDRRGREVEGATIYWRTSASGPTISFDLSDDEAEALGHLFAIEGQDWD